MDALREHGYIADIRLATIVFLVTRLDKPLLIEGPAGVGKTELAKALAGITGRRLLRLQCYEGQDETKALYEWDYGKQLLYTQILREKIGQVVADAPDLEAAVDRIGAQESVFFSERFLAARPLLESIRSEEPCVLLIDEVDRADEALEAVLLETLAEFQVSVPEVGTFTTDTPPYVILTSNNTRDLSAALKRRCLHLFLDYPSAERELEIIRSQGHRAARRAGQQLVDIVRGLRELELRKAPRSPRRSTGPARWPCSAWRSSRHRARGHRVGGREVRQGRPQGHQGNAPARRPQRHGARSRPRPRPRRERRPHPHGHPDVGRRPSRACGEGPGGQARRGLWQPGAVGPACRGRPPAEAARRHLEPGQPLFRAGPQARPVTVVAHIERPGLSELREETTWRAAGHWFETVAEAQRRAKKRLPKSVYMALVAGSSRASP